MTSGTIFTISAGGSCTDSACGSTLAGDYTVTGTDGAFTDTAILHVTAAALDHIVLSPDSATIAAGATQAYTAEGFDVYDNSRSSVTSGTIFTISAGASCTGAACGSTLAGDYTVTGTDGALTDTASLHVSPGALDHIVISPADSTIAAGATQTYTAEGFDSFNNSVGNVTSSTTFTISGAGTCDTTACGSHVAGDYTVTGTDGSLTDTAALHVTPASLDHIVISPADSTIAAGATQTYSAEGFDSFNNSAGNMTSSTTLTISGAGTCDTTACGSLVAGDYTVTGTDGSLTDTAALHVTPCCP